MQRVCQRECSQHHRSSSADELKFATSYFMIRDIGLRVGKPMHVPFYPEESLRSYTGFGFDGVEN